MAASYCLDVESFIKQVKRFPEIWDKRCEDSRHKRKKNTAWAQIASMFIEEFDDLPSIEKVDVYRKLHNKWRNIRDTYVRTLRPDREGRKAYLYADHLTFLNDLYYSKPHDDAPPAKSRKVDISLAEWTDVPVDDDGGIEFVDSHEPVAEDDRAFFESLLPAVRDFDTDQKLDFRSQVISLVKQIRGTRKESKRRDSEDSII